MESVTAFELQGFNKGFNWDDCAQTSHSLNSAQMNGFSEKERGIGYEKIQCPMANQFKTSLASSNALDLKISQLELENEQLINEMNVKRREMNGRKRDNEPNAFDEGGSYQKNDSFVQMLIKDNEELKEKEERYKDMLNASFCFVNLIQESFHMKPVDFEESFENVEEYREKLLEIHQMIWERCAIGTENLNLNKKRRYDEGLSVNEEKWYHGEGREEREENCCFQYGDNDWKGAYSDRRIEKDNQKNDQDFSHRDRIGKLQQIPSFGNNSKEHTPQPKSNAQQVRIRRCEACSMKNNIASRGYPPNACKANPINKKRRSHSSTPPHKTPF